MDDYAVVWIEQFYNSRSGRVENGDLIVVLEVEDENGNIVYDREKDFDWDDVELIVFEGFDGNDDFENDGTYIPCLANGGAGNDRLTGGYADDTLDGGPRDDSLSGGGEDGEDTLIGGPGKDDLRGNGGNDYLKAGTGEAEGHVLGGAGNDTFSMPLEYNYRIGKWSSIPVDMEGFDYDWREDDKTFFQTSPPITSKVYKYSTLSTFSR